MKIELLQKYLFIPLDIFTKNRQNRNINNKKDAWLTLFSNDDPVEIAELLDKYPEFKDIYEEGYQICLNMEKVMGLFSKELYMLDRNTEKYMFEEMQREMEEMQKKQEEIESKYQQALRNTVNILRSAGFSDDDIINRLCAQYQFEEALAKQYL